MSAVYDIFFVAERSFDKTGYKETPREGSLKEHTKNKRGGWGRVHSVTSRKNLEKRDKENGILHHTTNSSHWVYFVIPVVFALSEETLVKYYWYRLTKSFGLWDQAAEWWRYALFFIFLISIVGFLVCYMIWCGYGKCP